MNEEMLKDILEDVLQELKDANQGLKALQSAIAAMDAKVSFFEQKLNDQQVIVQPPDLEPALAVLRTEAERLRQLEADRAKSTQLEFVQDKENLAAKVTHIEKAVKEGLSQVTASVEAQPKPIVRQWRVSFFPENDHPGSYKHFVNWLFGAILGIAAIAALFFLGRQYLHEADLWRSSDSKLEMPQDRRASAPAPSMAAPVTRRSEQVHHQMPARAKEYVPPIHGLTAKMAKKQVDSMVVEEKTKKIYNKLKILYMLDSLDSARKNLTKRPQK